MWAELCTAAEACLAQVIVWHGRATEANASHGAHIAAIADMVRMETPFNSLGCVVCSHHVNRPRNVELKGCVGCHLSPIPVGMNAAIGPVLLVATLAEVIVLAFKAPETLSQDWTQVAPITSNPRMNLDLAIRPHSWEGFFGYGFCYGTCEVPGDGVVLFWSS